VIFLVLWIISVSFSSSQSSPPKPDPQTQPTNYQRLFGLTTYKFGACHCVIFKFREGRRLYDLSLATAMAHAFSRMRFAGRYAAQAILLIGLQPGHHVAVYVLVFNRKSFQVGLEHACGLIWYLGSWESTSG
jgi:ABC-type maltose transport system permease subunit